MDQKIRSRERARLYTDHDGGPGLSGLILSLIMIISSVAIVVMFSSWLNRMEAQAPADEKPGLLAKECTEISTAFDIQEGWERMHEADYRQALRLRSEGKANIKTVPIKCRYWYSVNENQQTFEERRLEMLWWRRHDGRSR